MINPFFKNVGPFTIETLLKLANIENKENFKETSIANIKDLYNAKKNDITFFHSKKYENLASKTKASFCITKKILSSILPKECKAIIVENVLISTAKITKAFYPNSVTDNFDETVQNIEKTCFKGIIKFGHNVLVGKNVTIGNKCLIGHNSIIESNVIIGNNCSIGSNVIIRNTIIKDNVHILDNCV